MTKKKLYSYDDDFWQKNVDDFIFLAMDEPDIAAKYGFPVFWLRGDLGRSEPYTWRWLFSLVCRSRLSNYWSPKNFSKRKANKLRQVFDNKDAKESLMSGVALLNQGRYYWNEESEEIWNLVLQLHKELEP